MHFLEVCFQLINKIFILIYFFCFAFWQRKYVNEKGETPLHEAAIAGNSQHVKELLEKVNAIQAVCWFFGKCESYLLLT